MNGARGITVHWFRRDLRLEDNHGLFRALSEHGNVQPLFIFDTGILDKLEDRADRRVDLIHRTLEDLQRRLVERGSTLLVAHGSPVEVWKTLLDRYPITAVTANHDHEPYAQARDKAVGELLAGRGIPFRTFKDISIFERNEVVKDDGGPYTVYTPYMRKWKSLFHPSMAQAYPSEKHAEAFRRSDPEPMPSLQQIGFQPTDLVVPPMEVNEPHEHAPALRHGERARAGAPVARTEPEVPERAHLARVLHAGAVALPPSGEGLQARLRPHRLAP